MKKINTTNKCINMKLIKVPKYLGDLFINMRNDTNIGTLNTDSSQQLAIKLNNSLKGSVPMDHRVIKKHKDNTVVVNTELDIVGIIDGEIQILPVINKEYLDFKKKIQSAETDTNQARLVNYFEEIKKGDSYARIKQQELDNKERRKLMYEKRRERLERSDVLNLIFKAYEKNSFWTVKDLANFTGQPVAYIQELITEVADLNKNDHKITYGLKPEYQ
ncbi:T2FB [Hepatospora eriocheir]|uniref:Transcription initiation factor IIF subunit beta n=1 Tax=Hepatospora eriocheir TaxID=1081669 RepID=A0A1X0QIL3_9MICR|nr:T2FB [Hepatospora eriocheir]